MPAKFQFSLEPLLEWRTRVEREKERDFAASRSLVGDCERELNALAESYRECATLLAASAHAGRSAELRLRDAHLRCLEAAMAKTHVRHRELQTACEAARGALVSASRERRIIEKLKERRQLEFSAEEARREELELDESNARQHERRARERLMAYRAESARP
jgi:flagellar protein FliJ